MIILDTNVVSEPMKPDGHRGVQAWLDKQIAETLYLTSISLSELLLGVEVLPDGKRKVGLAAALGELLTTLFGARVLPFDQHAATMYAGLVSRARAPGRAISMADGQIAAIAAVHGFTVATRDAGPLHSSSNASTRSFISASSEPRCSPSAASPLFCPPGSNASAPGK